MEASLADVHTLRVVLVQRGELAEVEREVACENCSAVARLCPSAEVELAPFEHGELNDPELDAPFDFAAAHPIRRFRRGGRVFDRVRMEPRTLGDIAPLWRARRRKRLGRWVVSALGVAAVGDERTAGGMARLLEDPEVLRDVMAVFEDAHYPRRLFARRACAECGARLDVPAPAAREADVLGLFEARADGEPAEALGFPSVSAFEALVREKAAPVFAALRVRGVDLVLEEGVPDCDEGGVPLLGSYTPPTAGDEGTLAAPPTVRVYYRAFRAEWLADARFDLAAEVSETIRHELEHHLAFLAGDDPVDDEERAAIAAERAALLGPTGMRRRAVRAWADDLGGFARTTWPLWVALGVAAALTKCGA